MSQKYGRGTSDRLNNKRQAAHGYYYTADLTPPFEIPADVPGWEIVASGIWKYNGTTVILSGDKYIAMGVAGCSDCKTFSELQEKLS